MPKRKQGEEQSDDNRAWRRVEKDKLLKEQSTSNCDSTGITKGETILINQPSEWTDSSNYKAIILP